MKKYLFVLCVASLSFYACKDEKKQEEKKEESKMEVKANSKKEGKVYTGEFIYVADAAVLKGNDFIYGVELDSMATALSKQTEPLKRDDYDMVPVTVRGKLSPNPNEEGWEEILKITQIIKVYEPVSEPAMSIKGEQENQ